MLPGGAIELGERHFTALEREVFEETNARISVGAICFSDTSFWYHRQKHYHSLCLFFLCDYKSGELSNKNLTPDEMEWDCHPFWLPVATAIDRGFALSVDWRSALQSAQRIR